MKENILKAIDMLIEDAKKELKVALEGELYGRAAGLQGHIAGLEIAKAIVKAGKGGV